ncbi:pentapeptide repeat-containing protein, partial [Streptomyces chitinivorans]|nr:pentapeptide repeat-containing protein [Streptomyces chitinivorans]
RRALRGAIVSPAQLLDLAPALARALGIEVRDD